MTSTDTTDKPFMIDKRRVYDAYKAVKSSKGGAGVDGQTIEAFEADLKGNLYRIWNRMSSGSYFPPPVRAVPIPKKSGGERILGVPTVGDRIAQMVVKQLIEPELDPIFLKVIAQAGLGGAVRAPRTGLEAPRFLDWSGLLAVERADYEGAGAASGFA